MLYYGRVVSVSGEQSLDIEGDSLDRYLKALAYENRRQLLYELEAREEEAVSVSEDVLGTQQQSDVEGVHAEYYHIHLPKLEELGIVDWDQNAGIVRRGPVFEKVSPLLEIVKTVESTEE